MPRSMTGFARQECRIDNVTLTWEIRSVNHRYLEPHFRLPDTLRELEPALREQLRQQLQRGKLEVSLHWQENDGEQTQLGINTALVEQLSQAAQQVQQHLSNSAPVNPLDILRWPGVIASQHIDPDQLKQTALDGFQQAVAQLIRMREREGAELQQLIEARLAAIGEEVKTVRARLPEILQAQRDKLTTRLQELSAELDHDRIEQEIVLLAQKADVDEELDRLDTHITEVTRTLNKQGSIGRRLDFLMQELNREANTLSSKSIVADTTQSAVELKVLIEQMREQIQNIE